ncbi:PHP-associated domain-containing protein [Halosegnis marinus]|uniref:PHP-associated domain-containing protein n=1 Tax=Halosegnis marinus TaxID=3034023 RepID=A0ABD5ZQ20_9EURY|nr:PHP-associated domain-containing protein [Halosegnis sp. DT85]
MFRVDPHVKVLDERVAERAKRRGLDALVYAPHFRRLDEIRARARRFSDEDLVVVPGREVFTGSWRDRKHVLMVGLSDPIPDFVTLDGAMAELRRQDGVGLVPHPEFATVSLGPEEIREYRDALHAVEVYNPKHRARHNDRAREVARETGLPAFGSSYAHLRSTVGEVWTEFDAPLRCREDVVEAFREGAPRRVFHRDGPVHTLRRHVEFAHLGYENTWKKADRLFLSGTEPTHPSNVAYDGRFDDVAVY